MKPSRNLIIAGCVIGAVLVTALTTAVDRQRSGVHQAREALFWSRQVAAQAEGMFLAARQKGERDPIGWATSFLTQGTEPRAMRIVKFQADSGGLPENYDYRREAGQFEFQKVFTPEDGYGVKITIQLPYVGFLGAKSRFAGDAAAFFFCVASFCLLFAGAMWKWGPKPDFRIKALIRVWLGEFKTVLTQLGVHIREMVREAQNLAVAAAKSKSATGELRDRIHGGINDLREGREALKEAVQSAAHAEAKALNIAIEASKLGEGSSLGALAEDLHRLVQKIRKLSQTGEACLGRVEVGMEPLATDADLAFHSYEDVFRATNEMDGHIRKTTETILGQARMMQSLNGELANDVEPVAKPAAKPAPSKPAPIKAGGAGAVKPAPRPRGRPPKKQQSPPPTRAA